MKHAHRQKKFAVTLVAAIIIGVILAAIIYYFSGSNVSTFTANPLGTASSSLTQGSSTSTYVASSSASTSAPVSTAEWQTYSSYELGFSMKYPSDLTVDTSNPAVFKVTFPTVDYFSTVYADNVSVSVSVASTCSSVDDAETINSSQYTSSQGINFTENETSDVGAGNIDDQTTYDTLQNNACYQIDFDDHHADGAGLYDNDPAQISILTTARDKEFAHVTDIVNAMISTFTFIYTPAGENESDYSASLPITGTGGDPTSTTIPAATTSSAAISMDDITPSTVSTGGQLTMSGQGFSGGDTTVWISNGSVQGVLWEGMPTSDSSIVAPLPDKACTQNMLAASCPSYLIISPGIYAVSVTNQNGTTDPVYLKVQ